MTDRQTLSMVTDALRDLLADLEDASMHRDPKTGEVYETHEAAWTALNASQDHLNSHKNNQGQ